MINSHKPLVYENNDLSHYKFSMQFNIRTYSLNHVALENLFLLSLLATCYLTRHTLYMEYASTVWAPYTKSSTENLEAIQRRTAKIVVSDYDYSSSISNNLNQFVWLRLGIRRQVSRLMMFYKIVPYQKYAMYF